MAKQNPIFTTIGKKTNEIPVEISYKILELFSGGLYSSPTKAIEELVANSFDAFASWVHVLISQDIDSENAIIAVVDDGDSMDIDGLKALWKIGESAKADEQKIDKNKRLPIGKFGIGKLATWVLSRELTHICKQKNKYLAVTMFYSNLDNNKTAENSKLNLDVRNLSKDEAKEALKTLATMNFDLNILFNNNVDSWTVSILSNLKPMVKDLKPGRLEWVLSTAMPLTPDFKSYLNNKEIKPIKLDTKPINKLIIGKNDKVADNLGFISDKNDMLPDEEKFGVTLPTLGRITGFV
ncbi:MAG: ATP-binding protein [Anaerolineales bacterium]|nr:ATP-binding protein [Anaerolineales bacterium]MBX3036309.1 ATP-binding protein [Anaerolineales bacterium]